MVLKKLLFILSASLGFIQAGHGQEKSIPYGNNAATGKYYDVRGVKLYTEVYGTGKPLLLIHGNGGSLDNFGQTIPYFSKKYKVIAVDSRAHGKSRDDRDSLSFEMMADDFAGLLDAMHVDSAYVIGWSDGGINAIELAMRHPNKVIKFAATGANLWPDSTGLIPSYWKYEQKEYNARKNAVLKTTKEKNDWKIFLLDWFQPNIKLPELKAIKCPALIIGGDHDLIPVQHTVTIAQNIPRSYLWIVPNSGHPTLIEHRDEFNKIVDDFFEKPFNKR
ncbi:Pimeloyl-ACP methyl ester carboxylesterase [Mucilaginibacter pineti]|uniref:Pimeloyl-ACP methyl ester carboxylesterase n=1 Tax=Mucilaginibacter pineti TaxID=1391627 RepID=A0A1G7GR30_9SPHI|nr:alpha/beta hydrolase [Mucilaginibacter pineti]SDE90419.1 Pimeloyl-ACP methyl ester carboxylesterase [Mucilaginibacter pineti]